MAVQWTTERKLFNNQLWPA